MSRGPGRRRVVVAIVAVGVALLVLAAVGAGVWVLTPYRAEAEPLAQADALPGVRVAIGDDAVVLEPEGAASGTGVVFYPGARVEAEAYAASWSPVVEAAGTTVVIPRMPLHLAVLDPDRADTAVADHGEGVERWYLGGHSLGGAMAASHAGGDPEFPLAGVVLWGAYATEGAELSGRSDLRVLSVTGSEDGLSDPATIDANRGHLPQDAATVEIDGMNHAQFGSYGEQSGDGTARIDDSAARHALAETVTDFLERG
ncbi:alpha/beta hydrolase family protein [Nocardiopsis sp. Huas11]|uniref:alpha/beta hydrolase n=1 Tax=Nocardiopsis sp. Huas11 TaxID=2183912 RepID=UPI000F1AC92C|nr:alpha/beta hydrolase [Nocardiopsis sp. Huas11]RKS06166.1 alpha/beta hydrolase family protein [Nocardiopsis sp. Huas11]